MKLLARWRRLSLLLLTATALGYFGLLLTIVPGAAAQSCAVPTPPTTLGQVKQSTTVASGGSYRVWSRIKAASTANNSYYLQVDGECAIDVGDASSIAADTWTWVNYKDGNTASVIDVTLTAGAHELTYTGKEADVQLDRVLLLGDASCVPTGTGDNCANADTVAPTVSLTAPAAGATITQGGKVTLTANAADNVKVAKVEFYVDNSLVGTATTAPYSYNWTTANTAAGNHVLTAKAYDTFELTATSSAVTISLVTANVAPTISITAPISGSSVAVGTPVDISATASDSGGIAKVEFYVDNTLVNTITGTTSSYQYRWTTTGVAMGAHILSAKAYDSSGLSGISTGVTVYVTAATPPVAGTNGDTNGDGRVNGTDYGVLAAHFGQNYPAADFNKDGTVNAADLAILLSKWTW